VGRGYVDLQGGAPRHFFKSAWVSESYPTLNVFSIQWKAKYEQINFQYLDLAGRIWGAR